MSVESPSVYVCPIDTLGPLWDGNLNARDMGIKRGNHTLSRHFTRMTYQLEGIPLQACLVILHFICLIAIFNRISDLVALITKLAHLNLRVNHLDLDPLPQPPPAPAPAPVRYGQSPSDLGGWTGSVKVTTCPAAPINTSPVDSTASTAKPTTSGSAPTTTPSRSFNLRQRPTSGTLARD